MALLNTVGSQIPANLSDLPTRPGVITQTTNAALGGLGTLGAILDTPGGIVRGIVNAVANEGDEWERIFTGIFDTSERVSGNELIGGDNDKFSWGGLGIEILTDPLTFVTFGATTAAGKLAKTAGKLGDDLTATRAFVDTGSDAAKRFEKPLVDQLEARIKETKEGLEAIGRSPDEVFGKTIQEQFKKGQRSLVSFDVPFTSIQRELFNNERVASAIGKGADAIATAVTSNPVSKEIREKFVTTRKDPVEEALVKNLERVKRQGVYTALDTARASADDGGLEELRRLLSATDETDLQVIKLLEDYDTELGATLGPVTEAKRLQEMAHARLAIEELYGNTDQFEDVWAFAQRIRAMNNDLLANEIASGVNVSRFEEFGYFARTLTPDAAAILKDSEKGRDIISTHLKQLNLGGPEGFQKARNFKELGLEDLNNKLAEELGKDPKAFKFFDTDVVSVQVNRMIQSSEAVAHARFMQAAVDLFKEDGKKLVERYSGKNKTGIKLGTKYEAGEGQTHISKIFQSGGVMARALKFKADMSKERVIENAMMRGPKYLTEKLYRRIDEDTIELMGVKFKESQIDDLQKKTLARVARNTDEARRIYDDAGPGHKKLRKRWDMFVDKGIMTAEEAGYLRAITMYMEDSAFEKIAIGSYNEKNNLKAARAAVKAEGGSYVKNGRITKEGAAEAQRRADQRNRYVAYASGKYADGKVGSGTKTPNVRTPTQIGDVPAIMFNENVTRAGNLSGAKFTFLHELGHIYHVHLMDDVVRETINPRLSEAAGSLRVLGIETVNNALAPFDQHAGNFSRTPTELFATLFALWHMGHRASDEVLEAAFKDTATTHKMYRDNVMKQFFEGAGGTSDTVLKEPMQQFGFLMDGLDNEEQLRVWLGMGPQNRLTFLSDLPDEPWQRRDYFEIDPSWKAKDIQQAMEDRGVVKQFLPDETVKFMEDVLGRSRYHLDSDKWWAKTIRVFDEIHGFYRTALTQYFPAFHARNWISNAFMNAMAGDVGVKHYYRAANMLNTMKPEEAMHLAALGVLDSGKMRDIYEFLKDTRGGISESMSKFMDNLPRTQSAGRTIHKVTRDIGHYTENHTRLAHYLAKKDAGLSDIEAADSVIKYLFDYNQLTDFEKAVPRRAMLFYTFFRKNMPLMLEQTFKKPRFMMTYARATGQTNPNIPEPEWLPDSFFLHETEKNERVRLNFGLPPEDLARFDPEGQGLGRAIEILIGNLVPAIKEPYQFVSGRDTFTGRPQEGGLLERLEAASPVSRATGVIRRMGDAASPAELGNEGIRLISGMSLRKVNEDIQKDLNKVEAIRDRLNEIVRQGGGRKIEIVGERRGQDNPEIEMLNSLQSQIHHRLRKRQEMLDQ